MMIEHIHHVTEDGMAAGYVVEAAAEQVQVYLSGFCLNAAEIASAFSLACTKVALLKNLWVEPECRGKGIGNALVSQFMQSAEELGADGILLIVDDAEEQAPGFSLEDWYGGFDFTKVAVSEAGPVMVFPSELAEQLTEFLSQSNSSKI